MAEAPSMHQFFKQSCYNVLSRCKLRRGFYNTCKSNPSLITMTKISNFLNDGLRLLRPIQHAYAWVLNVTRTKTSKVMVLIYFIFWAYLQRFPPNQLLPVYFAELKLSQMQTTIIQKLSIRSMGLCAIVFGILPIRSFFTAIFLWGLHWYCKLAH